MIVGTLEVRLFIREARTLKDKRQVIKSIKDKLRNNFNVSVAEVGGLDNRQQAILGIAMVCNEAHPIKVCFGKIVEALRNHPVAELTEANLEV